MLLHNTAEIYSTNYFLFIVFKLTKKEEKFVRLFSILACILWLQLHNHWQFFFGFQLIAGVGKKFIWGKKSIICKLFMRYTSMTVFKINTHLRNFKNYNFWKFWKKYFFLLVHSLKNKHRLAPFLWSLSLDRKFKGRNSIGASTLRDNFIVRIGTLYYLRILGDLFIGVPGKLFVIQKY